MGRQRDFADRTKRRGRREGGNAGDEHHELCVRRRRRTDAVCYDGVDGGGAGGVCWRFVCDSGSSEGRTGWEVSDFGGVGGAAEASSVGNRLFGSNADLILFAKVRSDASDSLKMAR